MIPISNRQKDDIIRILKFVKSIPDNGNIRTINMKRMFGLLIKKLSNGKTDSENSANDR